MNIGLIAHDSKKALMQNFCIAYRGILSKHNLYATGTTGRLVEEVTNLNIHKYLAGPMGGSQQLGAQIAQNDMDALIFLICAHPALCAIDAPPVGSPGARLFLPSRVREAWTELQWRRTMRSQKCNNGRTRGRGGKPVSR